MPWWELLSPTQIMHQRPPPFNNGRRKHRGAQVRTHAFGNAFHLESNGGGSPTGEVHPTKVHWWSHMYIYIYIQIYIYTQIYIYILTSRSLVGLFCECLEYFEVMATIRNLCVFCGRCFESWGTYVHNLVLVAFFRNKICPVILRILGFFSSSFSRT